MKLAIFAIVLMLACTTALAHKPHSKWVKVSSDTSSHTVVLGNATACSLNVDACGNALAPPNSTSSGNSTVSSSGRRLLPAKVLGAKRACNCRVPSHVRRSACGCPQKPTFVTPEIKSRRRHHRHHRRHVTPEINDKNAVSSTCCALATDMCGVQQVRCAAVAAPSVVPEIAASVQPELKDKLHKLQSCACAKRVQYVTPEIKSNRRKFLKARNAACACAQ